MKRLLAYLFIVLGLGLTFSVNAEADIKCFNPATNKVETWSSYEKCPGNRKPIETPLNETDMLVDWIEINSLKKPKTKIKIKNKNISSQRRTWISEFRNKNTNKLFFGENINSKKIAIKEGLDNCKNYSINKLNKKDGFGDCTLITIEKVGLDYFVGLLSRGHNIGDYWFSNNYKEEILALKFKKEDLSFSNKLPQYLDLLYQGKKLDGFFLEKSTLERIIVAKEKIELDKIPKYIDLLYKGKKLNKLKLEKKTLSKILQTKLKIEEEKLPEYIAILHKGETIDHLLLEKETLNKIPNFKLKTEEENIDKYLKADLKSEDLTKFNIEKETIELVKVKRQERKETLYAKTCTGWVFGHKKGTYEWFECLEDEEKKELFGETKVVANIKTKPSKTEKVIKTTSSDNEPPILNVVEALTVTDPRYIIEGKVTDKGSDKIYLKVDGQDVMINKGKFVINRYSPADETIKITAIDKWGNEVTKMIKVSVNMENSSVAEVLEPLNASKIKSKSSNNKVALIIGIEQYEQSPKASYANLDAKYFFDYARKAFGVKKNNIKMLIDQEASLSKTNSAIFKWLPGKIKANETDLIIFFSGHGLASNDGKEKYILPSNADPDLLSRTALSRSELFDEIVKLNPKSVTMFFDTCYSGVSRDEKTLLASAKPLRIVANDDKEIPDNFTIFTASKGDQISSGLKEAKHGIFSYYLMKGLEGKADANKDKDITNGELRAYMVKNVSDKALDLGRQQTPVLSGDPDKILMSYR
jgi:hypothetical protein